MGARVCVCVGRAGSQTVHFVLNYDTTRELFNVQPDKALRPLAVQGFSKAGHLLEVCRYCRVR